MRDCLLDEHSASGCRSVRFPRAVLQIAAELCSRAQEGLQIRDGGVGRRCSGGGQHAPRRSAFSSVSLLVGQPSRRSAFSSVSLLVGQPSRRSASSSVSLLVGQPPRRSASSSVSLLVSLPPRPSASSSVCRHTGPATTPRACRPRFGKDSWPTELSTTVRFHVHLGMRSRTNEYRALFAILARSIGVASGSPARAHLAPPVAHENNEGWAPRLWPASSRP